MQNQADLSTEWLLQVAEVEQSKLLRPRDQIVRLRSILESATRAYLALSPEQYLPISEIVRRALRTLQLTEEWHNAMRTVLNLIRKCQFEGYRASAQEAQSVIRTARAWVQQLAGDCAEEMPQPLALLKEPVGFEEALPTVLLVQADRLDKQTQTIVAYDDNGNTYRIAYGLTGFNAPFAQLPKYVAPWLEANKPVNLALVYPRWAQDGRLAPDFIVFEPEYLLDVTAVAECFDENGGNALLHLLNLLKPRQEAKLSLVLGQIVNGIFDEALPDKAFDLNEYLKTVVFPQFPLELTLLFADSTPEVRQTSPSSPTGNEKLADFRVKLEQHAFTIAETVKTGFATLRELERKLPGGIDKAHSLLEPSFFSPSFGLQGRLDLLHPRKGGLGSSGFDIVELKSGKPPPLHNRIGATLVPLSPGIHPNHEAQARLYRLLLESAFGPSVEGSIRLLYSQAPPEQAVREVRQGTTRANTDVLEVAQWAIHLRNRLVHLERTLAHSSDIDRLEGVIRTTLESLTSTKVSDYAYGDANRLKSLLYELDNLERVYVLHFIRMGIADKWVTKMGLSDERTQDRAQRNLWAMDRLDPENPALLLDLTLMENNSLTDEPYPYIKLQAQPEALQYCNLRVGDLVVLFPNRWNEAPSGLMPVSPTQTQVVKGVLAEMGAETLTVAFRQKQHFQPFFADNPKWALQPDTLDHGGAQLAQAMVRFANLPPAARQLLMGTRLPEEPPSLANHPASTPTDAIQAALSAPELYLLVGPPGTGKTRLFLKGLVQDYYSRNGGSLLLAAYTNRAVDEICEQLEDLGLDYLRIGSRHSTPPALQPRLHTQVFRTCTTRALLRQRLDELRIVVGTVASLQGQPTLFELKGFELVVLDEAAQLLEPHVLSLAAMAACGGRLPRLVMVGDPKQLPAVSSVPDSTARVQHTGLLELGLADLRQSLFERLLIRYQDKGCTWAWGQLTQQGRMHQDIMEYVSPAYYEGSLSLADYEPIRQKQQAAFKLLSAAPANALQAHLQQHRMVFLPISSEGKPMAKSHPDEAELAVRIAQYIRECYADNFNPEKHLGIITPWRGQIAEIKRLLLQHPDNSLHGVAVDTVERYQGSQRSCIILSLAVCVPSQVRLLAADASSGQLDRKLNVALTRAQEQIIVIGNPDLLALAPSYARLLEHIRAKGGWWAGA